MSGQQPSRLASQVSMDAEPWQHVGASGGARQPETTRPDTEQLYTGRQSMLEEKQTTNTSPTMDEFIEMHYDKLPKEFKVGYYDAMVLYSENDRNEAEKFRSHLENDIFEKEPGKIKAVLYDGPELEGLTASKLQHLDGGFLRCTYTFVLLTKQFVECEWCALSSETCLIEAIYNKDKKWCVVPVNTVQSSKADFRIPMGLNSLKGINYYNADEFYKKGVRRLIGDKINQRKDKERQLKQDQYNYLVKKVKQDMEDDHRRLMQHQHSQQELQQHQQNLLRSQSEYHQHQHTMQHSRGQQPKTAGYSSIAPNFPSSFKQPSEGDDFSSSIPAWVPKPDIEYGHQQSMNSLDSSVSKSSQKPSVHESQSAPSSLDSRNISQDYASQHAQGQYSGPQRVPPQHHAGAKEVHYHYHLSGSKGSPEQLTYNITGENVIIGENGQIIVDGKELDFENIDANPMFNRDLEGEGLKRRGSGFTSRSTFPMADGYQTGQSTGSQSTQPGQKENTADEATFEKLEHDSITIQKERNLKSSEEKGQEKSEINEQSKPKIGKATVLPNITSGGSQLQNVNSMQPASRPIKPFVNDKRKVAAVAAIKPNVVSPVPIVPNEETGLKTTWDHHETNPKVSDEQDPEETCLKSHLKPSSSLHDSEETEVLKAFSPDGARNSSLSSCETDGPASVGQLLTKGVDISHNHAHPPPPLEPQQETPFKLLTKEEQKRQQKEEKERIKRAKEEEKRRKKEEEKERKRLEKERKSKKGKEHISQEWDQAVTTAVRTEVIVPPDDDDESPQPPKRLSSFEENRVTSMHGDRASSDGDHDDVHSDDAQPADDNDSVGEAKNEEMGRSRVGEEFEL